MRSTSIHCFARSAEQVAGLDPVSRTKRGLASASPFLVPAFAIGKCARAAGVLNVKDTPPGLLSQYLPSRNPNLIPRPPGAERFDPLFLAQRGTDRGSGFSLIEARSPCIGGHFCAGSLEILTERNQNNTLCYIPTNRKHIYSVEKVIRRKYGAQKAKNVEARGKMLENPRNTKESLSNILLT